MVRDRCGVDHRTMRELFLDAAEAVWWLVTLPVRKVAADAMQEVLKQQKVDETPLLKWSDNDDDDVELPLRRPQGRRLTERLGLHR